MLAAETDAAADDAAFRCLRILQKCSDILQARLKWAQCLGEHSHVDTGVLHAYAIGAPEGNPFAASLRTAAAAVGFKLRKNPLLSSAACLAAGVLTAGWFYG